ncbi:MAG: HDIG domain-containing protein [Clostridia bacterium]|nr:HDIG domain-containing protein [Clostridia bacterium]
MKTTTNKNAYISATAIFMLSYVIIVAVAYCKYFLFGSFDGVVTSEFYVALAGCAISTLLILVSLITYLIYSRSKLIEKTKKLLAICTSLIFTYALCIVTSSLNLYYMPVAFVAFVVAPLADRRDSFITNITTNLIVACVLLFESIIGSKVDTLTVVVMMITGIFIGSIASYTLSNVTRRFMYVMRGLCISAVTFGLLFVSSYILRAINFMEIVGFVCLVSFAQPIVGLILQPIFESLFNIITNTKLMEFTDNNSPLMKRLIAEALGTYNHSMSVASFAEVCAMRIGENPYLAKACAYYHDVGKINNPRYFSENQSGSNPHDELLPEVSAGILRKHATDGFDLCQKYRIPIEIAHVTNQHHGTLPMAVFYNKATKLTDGEVDIREYSYQGPRPVTKIAAIIMICDASEAALRAKGKPTPTEVDAIVTSIINDRIARKQFDNCEITMQDLNVIKKTIIEQYGGLYHERVQYPDGKVIK